MTLFVTPEAVSVPVAEGAVSTGSELASIDAALSPATTLPTALAFLSARFCFFAALTAFGS